MAQVTAAINKGGCIACHTIPNIPNAVGILGPNLSNIGAEAGLRIPGTSAIDYIHQSILDPQAFVAPTCPQGACQNGIMPTNMKDVLTADEINEIVSYLLTLKTGS
jgi:nitrite reductase (NO-forming)/hydroxylamine reductase